jgi:opacity protein-like surface antigen
MKRLTSVVLAVFLVLCITTAASAESSKKSSSSVKVGDLEVDASLVLASAPASDFNTTLGLTIGVGKMLPQIDKNLQGRVEISYFSWSASEFGVDVSYTRVPIGAGARYFIPTQDPKLKAFVQGMLELSFDKVEAAVSIPPFGAVKSSASETRLGLVPGAGIEYMVQPNLGITADFRVHIITDSYYTLGAGMAYHF